VSTNFYVRVPVCENACEHCGRAGRVHLGQSAAGWRFLHQAYRDHQPTGVDWPVEDRASWLRLLDLGDIEDEYHTRYTRDELVAWIEELQVLRSRRRHMSRDFLFVVDGYEFSYADFT
jgi:hypothetical protein